MCRHDPKGGLIEGVIEMTTNLPDFSQQAHYLNAMQLCQKSNTPYKKKTIVKLFKLRLCF